jgi:hypothetical protein
MWQAKLPGTLFLLLVPADSFRGQSHWTLGEELEQDSKIRAVASSSLLCQVAQDPPRNLEVEPGDKASHRLGFETGFSLLKPLLGAFDVRTDQVGELTHRS